MHAFCHAGSAIVVDLIIAKDSCQIWKDSHQEGERDAINAVHTLVTVAWTTAVSASS